MVGGAGSGQQLQPPGSQPGLDGPDRGAVTRQRGVLLVPIAADGGVRAVLRADHQLLAYGAGAPGGLGEPGVDALAVVGMGAGQDLELVTFLIFIQADGTHIILVSWWKKKGVLLLSHPGPGPTRTHSERPVVELNPAKVIFSGSTEPVEELRLEQGRT